MDKEFAVNQMASLVLNQNKVLLDILIKMRKDVEGAYDDLAMHIDSNYILTKELWKITK